MKPGFVYVLSNPSMPGLLKVGESRLGAQSRAKTLFSTSIPLPFEFVYERYCQDAPKVEAAAHKLLEEFRVRQDREFFRVDASVAINAIESAASAPVLIEVGLDDEGWDEEEMEEDGEPISLRDARESLGMTQQQLSIASGVVRARISQIESGSEPGVYIAQMLSKALNVSTRRLWPIPASKRA